MASSLTGSGVGAVGAPPAIKLTRENFLSCQAQALPTLRGARVMGLLEGSDVAPPEMLDAEDANKKKISVPNPAYDTWITRDQQVFSYLMNSLSEDILSTVYGLVHAAEVWSSLHALYSSQSKSQIMPFGLKNVGVTYQRMMQKCLATQIGKNVQVYIDDIVITTKKGSTLIEDLKETFNNLDKFCLKLNPTKCSFGVPAGELLGFLVSARGIKANPEKIQAIVTMRKPTKLKEILQLTGRVAALSKFVARLGEKALPFCALIKQGEKFQWNEEAERASEDLKRTILTPPILVAPKEKEPLLLYIAATPQVVSTVLMVEREEEGKLHGVQRSCLAIPPGVFWEEIAERSTKAKKQQKEEKGEKASGAQTVPSEGEEEPHMIMMVQIPWMQVYITYILRKELPDDPVEARRVIRHSKAFTVVKGELYR
ncbi:hypothetical protein QYE76_014588 [Lolium multiflorum]|uniref:Reverse transcriptase domain-containing protein n=1 Tax=Lolium multiflorum TaxID=4521 RepID=A0AAD8X5Y6_LOLMU|nr:hypothetical protein QYE76_014588 [Lolium multiflorum]